MLDKLARSKSLVRPQLCRRGGEIMKHARLLFAQVGFAQFGARLFRLDLVDAGVDGDARTTTAVVDPGVITSTNVNDR